MYQSSLDDLNFEFAKLNAGEKGRKINVITNMAKVKIGSGAKVFMYNIEIEAIDKVEEKEDHNVPQANRLRKQKRMIEEMHFDILDRLYEDEKKKGNESIFSSEPIFDGSKNLYSRQKLNFHDRIERKVSLLLPGRRSPLDFNITITTPPKSHEIDLTILNRPQNLRDAEIELQALDIIITYRAKREYLFFNSCMFLKKKDILNLNSNERSKAYFELPTLKEASFGSYQACKITEEGVQLNVDRVAAVFHQGGNLLDLIQKFINEVRGGGQRGGGYNQRGGHNQHRGGGYNQRGGHNQHRGRGFNQRGGHNQHDGGDYNQRGGHNQHRGRGYNQRGGHNQHDNNQNTKIDSQFTFFQSELQTLNSELKQLYFRPKHRDIKLKFQIHSLTSKTLSELTFLGKEKEQIKVEDYMKERYKDYLTKNGISLLGNLPCVQVGNKFRTQYFPIELVEILDDQISFKKLNPKQQKEMTMTCGSQNPIERFEENNRKLQKLINSSSDLLRSFNIEIVNEFSTIKGRYFEKPQICGKDSKDVQNGEWKGVDFAKPAKLQNDFEWMFVNFVRIGSQDYSRKALDHQEIDDLISNIKKSAQASAINLNNPVEVIDKFYFNGKSNFVEELEKWQKIHPALKLIVFGIPTDEYLYSNIKYVCEVNFGIISQCVCHDKKRNFNSSYTNNLMLKINTKLGGTNYHLKSDSKVGFLGKKTMIMGLNLTHPSKLDSSNSIASATASFDSEFLKYKTEILVQENLKTEIVDLEAVTERLVRNFIDHHKGGAPHYVVVYRDGVSEGEFNKVIQNEIQIMKKAFCNLSIETNKNPPKLIYIIAQKRHHVRFLPSEAKDRDSKKFNPKPGLVVDSSIVSNFYAEFYLCPHRGAIGTTRPAKYIVLLNETDFTSDDIQQATYYYSHLLPRCQKSVSLVPAVSYSKLSTKRARSYLNVMGASQIVLDSSKDELKAEIQKLNSNMKVCENLENVLYYV